MHTWIRIITCIIILLLTVKCFRSESASSSNEFAGETIEIKGMIANGEGSTVILEEMGAREYIPLDTVICNDNGAFEFSHASDKVAFYVLRYGESGYVTLLIEPGENIEFEGMLDEIRSYRINGSKGSELLLELSLEHQKVLKELGEITRRNMELSTSDNYAEYKPALDRQFDSLTHAFHSYSLQFIHENAGSLAILVALYNMYGQGLPVFYPYEDLEIYLFVDSALMSLYSDIEAVQLLHAQVSEAEQALMDSGPSTILEINEIAPDFVSSRPDGSQMTLSELRGNYVLLSFWAGWSTSSREEHRALKEAHQVFGERNFRILQVSFDDNREVWLNAISEDQLDWEHVSDLKRWDTPVADLYQVEKIPSNLLIDPEGRIIDKDLYGRNLLEKLALIF